MRVPEKYYDEVFDFSGQWDVPSKCGLKLIGRPGQPVTVIVTELYQDNPGTSVTAAGYMLARQIFERKQLVPLLGVQPRHAIETLVLRRGIF